MSDERVMMQDQTYIFAVDLPVLEIVHLLGQHLLRSIFGYCLRHGELCRKIKTKRGMHG